MLLAAAHTAHARIPQRALLKASARSETVHFAKSSRFRLAEAQESMLRAFQEDASPSLASAVTMTAATAMTCMLVAFVRAAMPKLAHQPFVMVRFVNNG